MVNPIIEELVQKTFRELAESPKPIQRSRVWKSTNGYIFLVAWSNASLLRILIRRFTDSLTKSNYRFKNQIDDAARSVIANIEEGFARPTTSEYLTFLGYSQASLKEVKGDIQRARQDRLIISVSGSGIVNLGIEFKSWHDALKASTISRPVGITGVKGDYRNLEEIRGGYRKLEEFKGKNRLNFSKQHSLTPLTSYKFLYPPVDDLEVTDLTYEIFIELINKTDWHLQKLVNSLENKLSQDKKYYQVENARIRGKL